ncbi:MAG: TIGR02186 family protein [Pseudotabrizicola sp.]|uniref:TIGR02186 family protein n=1 Tax=Pseudotabrizicola sp. TaxID=2939647 RepID=UPI002716BE5B|nr:TIGR02186 family protein [Pseudotabrizicola sp.]MDO9641449.1 TIGR02186 family protein [Pseudotabrizicola sp.]
MIRAALIWLLTALPALAASEDIVAGLSQNRVSITADFEGSEILIYGAIKRTAPVPPGALHIIITVEGPSRPLTVRKKERTAGIWINREAVQIASAPSFYAIATTGHLRDILTETENLRHQITIPRAIRAVGISQQAQNAPEFLEALIRVREAEDRYRLRERSVQFTEATLFRSDVVLPANLTEGLYRVRIFLTRDGQVVDRIERQINVRKEGLERFLFNLSRDQPLIYGLLSLLIAVVAGYGASAAFRFMKR